MQSTKEINSLELPTMTAPAGHQIVIRDLNSIDELSQLREVEKQVWGMADNDTLPLTLAIASKAAGNIFSTIDLCGKHSSAFRIASPSVRERIVVHW